MMRASARVRGIVVDADGRAIQGARVLVHEDEFITSAADADDSGVFSVLVPAEPSGALTVEAVDPSPDRAFRGETSGVRPGQSNVQIVVER